METIIYVDILFIINFIMDGLCIALTAALLGKRLVLWRFICACILGGLYSLVVFPLEMMPPVFAVLLHLLAAFLICIISIKWKSFGFALSSTSCYFFVNALLGGVLYALYSICGCYVIYNGAFYAELSAAAVIASGIIVATVLLFCLTKHKARNAAGYCELRISFREKNTTASCIVDSGNLLRCPYTGLPVAIISQRAAKGLFSDDELSSLALTPAMEKVRPLPVKGIGGATLLPSFIPEKAQLCPFGKRFFDEINVCVAIKFGNESFGKSDGIIPATLL